jgi:hypothetical protein
MAYNDNNIRETITSLTKKADPGIGCGTCDIVAASGDMLIAWPNWFKGDIFLLSSPTAPVKKLMTFPDYDINYAASGFSGTRDVAKFGKKIWYIARDIGYPWPSSSKKKKPKYKSSTMLNDVTVDSEVVKGVVPTAADDWAIVEVELNQNCTTVSFKKIMPIILPSTIYGIGRLSSLTAKNSTTLIAVASNPYSGDNSWWAPGEYIIELDVTGMNAIPTFKFMTPLAPAWTNSPYNCMNGDLQYFKRGGQELLIGFDDHNNGNITLVDYNQPFTFQFGHQGPPIPGDPSWTGVTGVAIDQIVFPNQQSSPAFCFDSKIYGVSGGPAMGAFGTWGCGGSSMPCPYVGQLIEMDISGNSITPILTGISPSRLEELPHALLGGGFSTGMVTWGLGNAGTSPECCNPELPPITTYDCVPSVIDPVDKNSSSSTSYSCVQVTPPNVGVYTSLSACQQNCGNGGWDCKTITNVGQPGSYQTCIQISAPNVGAYTTLSDCQNGFINGGFGPCKKPLVETKYVTSSIRFQDILYHTPDLTKISTTDIKTLVREIQAMPKDDDGLYSIYKDLVASLLERQ